jgi:hypothetical protein
VQSTTQSTGKLCGCFWMSAVLSKKIAGQSQIIFSFDSTKKSFGETIQSTILENSSKKRFFMGSFTIYAYS